jgi:WD40 repeat protein
VAFSLDGKTLALPSGDWTIKMWDVGSGVVPQTLSGHLDWVSSVASSPDSKALLASASWDKTAKLWDTQSGVVLQTFKGHSQPVLAVAFSSDGKTLASTSYGKTVKLWDAGSGAVLQMLDVGAVAETLSFPSDGISLRTNRGSLPISSSPSDVITVPQHQPPPSIIIKDQYQTAPLASSPLSAKPHCCAWRHCRFWIRVRKSFDDGIRFLKDFFSLLPTRLCCRGCLYVLHG